jgi:Spy/CpxP family protein refolding chaperone
VREQLARLLAEGTADDNYARRVAERVNAVERDRNVARTLLLFRMYRLLTPEQRRLIAEVGQRAPSSGFSITRR